MAAASSAFFKLEPIAVTRLLFLIYTETSYIGSCSSPDLFKILYYGKVLYFSKLYSWRIDFGCFKGCE